ncbi:ABC-2 type transporter domain-containing protein [Apiospora hydei]|uniref:ABC-2 type transporter domain-containing protein n=1 Tax=Apiospora hydei TaxID=1337664 RepID=A0ABR1WA19_9PEZI
MTFLLIWLFNLWANTLSQAFGVGIEHAETVVQAAMLCFWLSLVFCGVLVPPDTLPGFWIFLYRVSPLTYLIEGLAGAGLADLKLSCSEIETLHLQVPEDGQDLSCGQYLASYSTIAHGYVVNPEERPDCLYCPVGNANTVLQTFEMNAAEPWRDVGFMAAYVLFNILATFLIYWLARVPRRWKGNPTNVEVDLDI